MYHIKISQLAYPFTQLDKLRDLCMVFDGQPLFFTTRLRQWFWTYVDL